MGDRLSRVLAVSADRGETPAAGDWVRALSPIAAPLLIVLCGLRTELFGAAAAWSLLIIPGVLAVNLFFPSTHPLGHPAARFGVASVIGLLPFAVPAWTGCMLHWTLSTVLWVYALVYAASVAALVYFLLRRPPARTGEDASWPALDLSLTAPRWSAAVLIASIVVVMVGVCLASPPMGPTRYDVTQRPDWWHGVALGAAASVAGALAILAGYFRRASPPPPVSEPSPRAGKTLPRKHRPRQRGDRAAGRERDRAATNRPRGIPWDLWAAVLLWVAAAGMTVYIMRVTYTASAPEEHVPPWNVDDVAYVSEAVDYRYGHVLGKHEPSLGSEHGLKRQSMSPLVAPLVAAIARATGISCAALHHAVLPPLVVLAGMSCLAAALLVVLRMHRLAVPLGLLIAALMIYKSWDYARCVVEMLVFRAMQTKAIHLWLIHPLQLASLVLLARRSSFRHLGLAVVVALVGHSIHPFSTITGLVWATTMVVAALLGRRRALFKLAVVLAVYCALGGLYDFLSHRPLHKEPPRSGRRPGSPIESRDLVRVERFRTRIASGFEEELDRGEVTLRLRRALAEHQLYLPRRATIARDTKNGGWVIGDGRRGVVRVAADQEGLSVFELAGRPILRHDPFWSFGMNTLFHSAALAIPLVLAFGWRRREILCVGLLGAAVLLTCNFEPLGKVLNVALPTAIMWRARWMVPALVILALLAVVLYWALAVLVRRRDHTLTPARALLVSLLVAGAFVTMLYNTTSRALKPGPVPRQLDKFSEGVHGLIELLGGVEADPYVWGSWYVHHELPQLMPNVKLVFSRVKIMRTADHDQYRRIVTTVFNGFRRGTVEAAQFEALLSLYPIDHVVLDYRFRDRAKPAAMLGTLGWRRIGRSGPYEVWRAPGIVPRATAAEPAGKR